MGWVRVSDDFYDHDRFAEVGPLGLAVWITGLAYCNRNLTDGRIPKRAALRLMHIEGIGVYEGNYAGRDAQVETGETLTGAARRLGMDPEYLAMWLRRRGAAELCHVLRSRESDERTRAAGLARWAS